MKPTRKPITSANLHGTLEEVKDFVSHMSYCSITSAKPNLSHAGQRLDDTLSIMRAFVPKEDFRESNDPEKWRPNLQAIDLPPYPTEVPVWQDDTSYSRGERGTIEPRGWRIRLGGITVCLFRPKIEREHDLTVWHMNAYPFPIIMTKAMGELPVEVAKKEALLWIKNELMSFYLEVYWLPDAVSCGNPQE